MESKDTTTAKLFNPGLFRSSSGHLYLIGLRNGKPIEPITLVDASLLLNTFEADSRAFKSVNAAQNNIFDAATDYMVAMSKDETERTPPDFNFLEAVEAMAAEYEDIAELKDKIQNCICRDEKTINEYVEALKSSGIQS